MNRGQCVPGFFFSRRRSGARKINDQSSPWYLFRTLQSDNLSYLRPLSSRSCKEQMKTPAATALRGKLRLVPNQTAYKRSLQGLGWSLVAECLPSMSRALCSISNTIKRKHPITNAFDPRTLEGGRGRRISDSRAVLFT